MADIIFESIFPKINRMNERILSPFSKDLFTKKLGHNIMLDLKTNKKNYASLTRPNFFKKNKTLHKNNTNSQLSLNKENNLRKIWEPKKLFIQKIDNWGKENYKRIINIQLDSPQKITKSKKEIKKLLSNIKNDKPKRINFDSIPSFKNFNNTIVRKLKKENNKDIFEHKKIIKNKRISFHNFNKSENNKINVIERISKEEKNSKIFIKSFFESLIDIYISYELYNSYKSLVNKFNEIYFFLFEIESFPINPLNIKFLDIYKYTCILNIVLIFISKDKNLYTENILKMKDLLKNYIFDCINSFDYKVLNSFKIDNIFPKIKSAAESMTILNILNDIILLIFSDKKNDYKKLRKCLRQLINNIGTQTPNQVLSIINDSILFSHNCDLLNIKTNEEEKIDKHNISKKNKTLNDEKTIQPPFIKKKMIKNFCLVLDLDETLIHNLHLPFGDYFLVRPGVFHLLNKVHEIYEIIIFTAGKKRYAYNIINKIDYKNYVDYILYKKHLVNEEGTYIKKLELIGRDLNKIIYVDNSEKNAKCNKKNLYLISSWYNNIFDKELFILEDKLLNIAKSGKFDNDITKGIITE